MAASKPDLAERLAFLRFTEADRAALAELGPTLERHADTLIAGFYRHLLSFEVTRRLLRSPEVKERLLAKQREYLLSLAGPRVDLGYLQERARIGDVHERIGLEPFYYLAAYANYFSLLHPLVRDGWAEAPGKADQIMESLVKLLVLDATVAMEAYMDRREGDLEHLNRELAATGRRLAEDVEAKNVSLRETAERARAAEELASLASLATGLAHEIGTPMGVIQGHARLLESDSDPERAGWRARTIREQVERIAKIVQALQSLGRRGSQERKPLPLATVLDRALSFLEGRFGEQGVRVERRYEPAPPVHGDAERLQQLFLNLFMNAADAMPDGGHLRVRTSEGPERQAVVQIADTGAGIDREALPRIFDPFFTTKPAGHGSGLGLVVALGAVLDHGGTIDVQSEPGRGTAFEVALPGAGTGEAPQTAPDQVQEES
jgi:signal transduction histidine kinase